MEVIAPFVLPLFDLNFIEKYYCSDHLKNGEDLLTQVRLFFFHAKSATTYNHRRKLSNKLRITCLKFLDFRLHSSE